ncbi:MAG: GDP-mannose 4,6-dehydratase [Snowella sp.]|nr:GDP-mannose 4,6-dehydratase [Snowella sp.]
MKIVIVGHRGQDGTLLCRSLKNNGDQVFGFSRSSTYSTDPQYSDIQASIEDSDSIYNLVDRIKPNQVYYLAAHHASSETLSENNPKNDFYISQLTHVIGPLNFLSAIYEISPNSKFFYASSSLVFSAENGEVQNEETSLSPQGFYGITKAEGMLLCREFRERFNVFASVGILYNHESYLRPDHFLSQKIIQSAIRIASGSKEKLVVGDLSSRVDWGYAPDYVKAFQDILGLNHSEDFIISTGEAHSVKEFVEIAFKHFKLDPEQYVIEDPNLLRRRPPVKIGDSTKLKTKTGWKPSLSFPDFVKQLITDLQ